MSLREVPVLTAALALALLANAHLSDPSPAEQTTGSVRGRVLQAPNLEPVGFSIVVVQGSRRGAVTDEDGRFVVKRVPLGSYLLRVSAPGAPGLTREIDVQAGTIDLGDIIVPNPSPPPAHPVPVGARTTIDTYDLEVRIRSVQSRYRVGETPEFQVRIRNVGDAAVLLVDGVEQSDTWASPRVLLDVKGPLDGFVIPKLAPVGSTTGIDPADFREVAPGEEFDPYVGGGLVPKFALGRFERPGRYKASFRYVTTAIDPRYWMGVTCCPDTSLPRDLRQLLMKVPAVDLTASTSFDVVP